MSRSNPTETKKNPSVRWFEWSGKMGEFSHYDKEAKAKVAVPLPFQFVLLDELSTIKGWHDASESGISSNEVRNMRLEPLVVRSFKGGELANGLYATIKDKVAASGGHYVANLYIGAKIGSSLQIASIQLGGAALSAWFEFRKASGDDLYKKAITVGSFKEGKKGSVVFKVPQFKLVDLTPATHEAAVELDKRLQSYLDDYFRSSKVDSPAPVVVEATEPSAGESFETAAPTRPSETADDDVPF